MPGHRRAPVISAEMTNLAARGAPVDADICMS
jgi:hypothetical protein